MTDYTLNWSETSVGPTITYDASNSTRSMLLDTSNLPSGVGATGAISWPKPADSANYGFSLPITLASAGTVTFYRMTDSEPGSDFLRFYIDGVLKQSWAGSTAWGQVSFALASGAHTLRWTYNKDSSVSTGTDTVRVALLNITNVSSAPPTTNSSNTPKVYDFEDGAIPSIVSTSTWTNSTSGPISGTRSLRTPATTAASTTYSTTITPPSLSENGVVAFDYKRDAEGSDRTTFTFNSRQVYQSNTNTESKRFAFIVPASTTTTMDVTYTKDAGFDVGADASWLDNISIPYQVGVSNTISSAFTGSGTISTKGVHYTIRSGFSGSGALATHLNWPIHSSFSGSGSLSTVLGRFINSQFSGVGTLSTRGVHATIRSGFSGAGTLTTVVAPQQHLTTDFSGAGSLTTLWTGYRNLNSQFSGLGTLSTVLFSSNSINSDFSGAGTLYTAFSGLPVHINSGFSAEGVLFTELEYLIQPLPLEALPLGKLVRYTISTAGVPLNPAEGSGSTPSVNATYVKGRNPEFALGENFTVDNGAVGRYTGEIVRLALGKKSDVATISTDTLLTLANVDKHLYPFIDAAPTTWTAARAIDYWTQQCGMFYDKVDGECAVYASGYGHSNGFAAGATTRFYEKLTGGLTATSVIGNRSVASFGAAVTSSMAQHEAPKTRVPITVGANRKMVFSLGLGIRGTGRTASATYNFIDGADNTYAVTLEGTSAGGISAKVAGSVVATTTVAAGDYRVSFSIQRMSDSAMAGKLTVHEDDLAGTGDLIYNGPSTVFSTVLPGTLWLTSLVHASAGGFGAQMLRWGTYLSVAKFHPMALPAVQKTFSQSSKVLGFASGFTGNVWKLLNEFCSINRLDISFVEDRLIVGPRTNGFNGSVKFSEFDLSTERREKYKQVAVVNKQSKAVATNDAVFYRADSVFQVAAREVFETTVQTGHSILSLVNPVAVAGIEPFPYIAGSGQYVVTGADGYIVAPAWWNDNGGKIEVSLTDKDGEIAIKITAPTLDTVRAPYRISEGAGDRPALYISGSGIVNKPVELHINSGARKAKEGFDQVFESPFIATTNDAYNTAARMAHAYSAAVADVSYEATNNFDTPSELGIYPSGVVYTDNERNFKIKDSSQTHSKVSGNAVPFTTIAAYKASFPAGATIRDEKARHKGRTIKQANIKPLRSNDESA